MDEYVSKREKMQHLVDVYSNMKPKQAAQVLETLDESIAVRILYGQSLNLFWPQLLWIRGCSIGLC